jgi:hypothetical protein
MPYTQNPFIAQAQPNGFISVGAGPSDNFIEILAQSPRGDMRALAAILTINAENAAATEVGGAATAAYDGDDDGR